MNKLSMPSSSLLRCPKCNEFVAERNMKRHTNKVHNPEKEAQRRLETQRLESAKFLEGQRLKEEARLRTLIPCSACSAKIQLKDVKSHFGNVHSAPAPAALLAMLGEDAPRNRFANDRAREQYWRAVEGVSVEHASEDLFDRTKVQQGGAYGLGKSRKH